MKGTLAYSLWEKNRILGYTRGRRTTRKELSKITGISDSKVNEIVEDALREGELANSVHKEYIIRK